jgi:hypothetical protein
MMWLRKGVDKRERWHQWFAWHPVTLSNSGGVRIWFEWIERREEWVCSHGGDTFEWEYRLPKEKP